MAQMCPLEPGCPERPRGKHGGARRPCGQPSLREDTGTSADAAPARRARGRGAGCLRSVWSRHPAKRAGPAPPPTRPCPGPGRWREDVVAPSLTRRSCRITVSSTLDTPERSPASTSGPPPVPQQQPRGQGRVHVVPVSGDAAVSASASCQAAGLMSTCVYHAHTAFSCTRAWVMSTRMCHARALVTGTDMSHVRLSRVQVHVAHRLSQNRSRCPLGSRPA